MIATASNVLAPGDLYTNQAALPPRWRANANWMMNLSILNGFRQLPQATGLNYSIVNDSGPIPTALGWEIRENSTMDGTLTGAAADYLVLSGDFQQYAIVDRVGTQIEVVSNLFGATNDSPPGSVGSSCTGASAQTSSSPTRSGSATTRHDSARRQSKAASQFVAEVDGKTVVVIEGARFKPPTRSSSNTRNSSSLPRRRQSERRHISDTRAAPRGRRCLLSAANE